jgi:hypothetical protein
LLVRGSSAAKPPAAQRDASLIFYGVRLSFHKWAPQYSHSEFKGRHAGQARPLACCDADVRFCGRAGQALPAFREHQDTEVDPMATVKLDKEAWHSYFDRISKMVLGKQAEIEVASLNLGDQIQAEWVPLLGITYDPKNDLVEVLLEGLDHLIRHPRHIYVDHGPAGLTSMEVIDTDDVRQIIRLRDPIMLPYSAPAG